MRSVVLALAVGLLILSVLAALLCGRQTLPGTIVLGLIVAGLVFERRIYKVNQPGVPGAGWIRTPERFTDPTTGQAVVVYFKTDTGERRCVVE